MFRLWYRFKKWKTEREKVGAEVSMSGFQEQVEPIRKRIKALLEEGVHRNRTEMQNDSKSRTATMDIYKHTGRRADK
ncbi:hypothetical protein FACS1894204_13500 [Synergistales bacterium]|nr:hypothetical protein FACS1894204_13500 [Synergistales bacterium]